MTTQQVDPTRHDTPGRMLINAMAAAAGDTGDIVEIFKLEFPDNGKCLVEVELKVNGVSVPFIESIRDGWAALEGSIDREVEKRALELISAARLDKIQQALSNAEWQIEDALRNALKGQA